MKNRARKLFAVNAVTSLRLFVAVIVVWLTAESVWVWAAGLLLIGVLTDLIDGHLARRWEVVTKGGGVFDAQLDRLLLISPLVGWMIAGGLPVWLGIVLSLGVWLSDLFGDRYGIRLFWWILIYATIGVGVVTHLPLTAIVVTIIVAIMISVVVAIAKPKERREILRTLKLTK